MRIVVEAKTSLGRSVRKIAAFLTVSTALASCSANGPFTGNFAQFDDTVTIGGTNPVIDREALETLNLPKILDPSSSGFRTQLPEDGDPEFMANGVPLSLAEVNSMVLEQALNNFYAQGGDLAGRRNRVQDRIFMASNQRCAVYKKFLRNYDIEGNLALGYGTTLTAGLGAVVTHDLLARVFAGAATILSGWRAEFNEVQFQTKTIQVLTRGIDLQRREILKNINRRRTMPAAGMPSSAVFDVEDLVGSGLVGTQDLKNYTVEAAIGDALFYDDHCSLNAGLEYAALALERQVDPGLRRMQELSKEFPAIFTPALRGRDAFDPDLRPTLALAQVKSSRDSLNAVAAELQTLLLPDATNVKGGSGSTAMEDVKTKADSFRQRVCTTIADIKTLTANEKFSEDTLNKAIEEAETEESKLDQLRAAVVADSEKEAELEAAKGKVKTLTIQHSMLNGELVSASEKVRLLKNEIEIFNNDVLKLHKVAATEKVGECPPKDNQNPQVSGGKEPESQTVLSLGAFDVEGTAAREKEKLAKSIALKPGETLEVKKGVNTDKPDQEYVLLFGIKDGEAGKARCKEITDDPKKCQVIDFPPKK